MILLHNIGSHQHSNYNTREEIKQCKEQLSFDGVYLNVWKNKDLLLNRKEKSILFIMGKYIGKDNSFDLGAPLPERYCDYSLLIDLEMNFNCTLAYHSFSHRDLTTIESDVELIKEITPPFRAKLFAYPYGKFNDRVIEFVKKCGYEDAYSVDQGNGGPFQRLRSYLKP